MEFVDRISDACRAVLPDATVILHGSLGLGDSTRERARLWP
jgi:hypothetical protein